MDASAPILVAGRNGQLARCLDDSARAAGVKLAAMGHAELDLADPAAAERAIASLRPRVVINAAAYTAVDQAEAEPAKAMEINRDGAARLAAAAVRHGARFIHVSTDYVFDGTKPSPYVETDRTSPLGAYGRSKLDGEIAVRAANPSAIIFRTAWVYSNYGHNFVRTMLRLAETRDVVRVVDDQQGSPTSAADLADGLLAIVRELERGKADAGGLYNLAGSGSTTWYGFAGAIFAGWAERGHRVPRLEPIPTSAYPTPAKRPGNSRLDCSLAEKTFGVTLPDWRDGLRRCLDRLGATAHAA